MYWVCANLDSILHSVLDKEHSQYKYFIRKFLQKCVSTLIPLRSQTCCFSLHCMCQWFYKLWKTSQQYIWWHFISKYGINSGELETVICKNVKQVMQYAELKNLCSNLKRRYLFFIKIYFILINCMPEFNTNVMKRMFVQLLWIFWTQIIAVWVLTYPYNAAMRSY